MTSAVERKVWEVLSDFNNISESDARQICDDFTSAGVELPAEELASKHTDMIQHVYDAMPDIREAMIDDEDTDNPFFGATKVSSNEADCYLKKHGSAESCSICLCEGEKEGDSVVLSCNSENNCTGVFCKKCISTWITSYCARCPCCRAFTKKISPNDVKENKTSKKKVVIYIKKKQSTLN